MKGYEHILFILSVILLASLLSYGSGSLPLQPPSVPSGGNALDLIWALVTAVFSYVFNGIVLVINGLSFSWIPYPYNWIIALPFWILLILASVQLFSSLIDKLKGWI